jgi:hypothetical protein
MTVDEVKDCFAQLGLSQRELAKFFDVHRRTIGRWLAEGIPETTPASRIAALRLRSMMHLKMVKESTDLEHYGLAVGEFVSQYRKASHG